LVGSEQDQNRELYDALKKAEKSHGHLCPFLVLGVRTSLIGLRELAVKGDNGNLRVTLMSQNPAPYPCFIDGIQVTTNCTLENKKLMIKVLNNFPRIEVKFETPSKEPVVVTINPVSFDALSQAMSKLFSENFPPEKFQQLVQHVASMPEEELFITRRK
jgi:formylmethanofuran dehydrogenase subunit E